MRRKEEGDRYTKWDAWTVSSSYTQVCSFFTLLKSQVVFRVTLVTSSSFLSLTNVYFSFSLFLLHSTLYSLFSSLSLYYHILLPLLTDWNLNLKQLCKRASFPIVPHHHHLMEELKFIWLKDQNFWKFLPIKNWLQASGYHWNVRELGTPYHRSRGH